MATHTPTEATGSGVIPVSDPARREPVLTIEDLDVHFPANDGSVARVVDRLRLTVNRNEIIGIAGESGSGKTTLVEAILGISRFPNRRLNGRVLFETRTRGQVDLATISARQMRRLRLEEIAYIPQGSMNSLNPVLRVGDQIADGMIDHGVPAGQARGRVPELLERVGLEARVARLFPHELSGGMKQRVIIAIAIAMSPSLIVADEPTTALDVNVQRRILETLARLRDEMQVAIMLVSHDMAVHAQLVDRVGIMYAGQIVETGEVREAVKRPMHPYTAGLMQAIPSIDRPRARMEGIRGATPSPRNWPEGCRFHDRCPRAMPVCRTIPPLLAEPVAGRREGVTGPVDVIAGRQVACHLYPESTPPEARSDGSGRPAATTEAAR
ncbi:MAG TPA: ABC transporter ATP-binding protein [Thermomicrobiales bacterium]|jgi:peptide/nickel transport system ATP-binding protein|nr:ABC transporter ATP-binding protein [Thermomicrobiales bacterium]